MSKEILIKNNIEKKVKPIMSSLDLFRQGIFAGIGWALGVTIGFVMISMVLVFVVRSLGGMPIIGNWIALIVEETQKQLSVRTPTITPH
ncbi:hypothetical protein IPM62_03045 [Candidatus Woesebacteria bacterium]|nr:MAG: hypothetical protein IPM62_03045 [Candidatus Woesebacteria bacterium]